MTIDTQDHERLASETTPLLAKPTKALSVEEQSAARWQIVTLCWSFYLVGWGDGTVGPLIPPLQAEYGVDFSQVSYIFIAGCTGAILGQLCIIPMVNTIGFGRSLVLGAAIQTITFVIQSYRSSYWVFLLVHMISKTGVAFGAAQANAFVAILKNDHEMKMGYLHAAYGFGALTAPLSATYLSHAFGWRLHYATSAALALSNVVVLWYVFGSKSEDYCLREAGEDIPDKHSEGSNASQGKFGQLMSLKIVHVLSAFIIVYVGTEVTIGGWIVTFMLRERNGGSWSGYVATGFFGGLTLGRIILISANRRLGEVKAIYLYCAFAMLFQLVVWFTPNFFAGAIAASLVGMFLGPMFPLVMTFTAKVVPRPLVSGAVGWIGASGALGATFLPYFTGILAKKYGIAVSQPYSFALLVCLCALWAVASTQSRKQSVIG